MSTMRLVTILAFFYCNMGVAETITIDAERVVGPALHRASGFLNGFAGDTVPDRMLVPIKTGFLRTYYDEAAATYSRCKKINCAVEVVVNHDFNTDANGFPGDNGSWDPWDNYVGSLMDKIISTKMTDISFSIWNSTDRKAVWPRSDLQYFQTWQHAYQIIKAKLPDARLAGPTSTHGPNSSWWVDHPDDDLWYVKQFLLYCKANNCLPDILARHDHYADGSGIERDAANLEKFYSENGIEPLPFEQSDCGPNQPKNNLFSPGIYVSLFASIERVKVLRTAKCSWDRDGIGKNRLDGLLTEAREPRALWWTYKAYADITGSILPVVKSASIDAVAGTDNNGGTIRVLAGNFKGTSKPLEIRIVNFSRTGGSVAVKGYEIADSNRAAADEPRESYSRTVEINNGEVVFSVDDLPAYAAYSFTVEYLNP